ncbi:hypothetical protein KIN20_017708 [Parelaphostrongylus tenuis]|uniref:RuvB-like helicase n=1 Tax=Parelaphostrongylus tenuis TaxID=148309 RepID=A0AAD5QTZ0_PARTN|nr:hypothetical protein KIN20_017708 [Parelaphostrongylus tenuis]
MWNYEVSFGVERVGAHSHIHGLGVASNFDPEDVADGMVGQIRARKAAAIVVKMVQVCSCWS